MARSTKVTEFLKECIADAILSLLKEKSIDKITVDEIVKVSGVGRTTYFRYFKRKEDAITFKFVKMWERWTEENNVVIRKAFAVENARTFFSYNHSIRDILTLIYKNHLHTAILDSFILVMKPEDDTDAREIYTAAFYAYGLYGMLEKWIARDFAESIDEMANCARNLFSHLSV